MKDILIIAHFTQIPGEKGNGRFHYIAQKLNKRDINIEVVTSSFSHKTKKQREISRSQLEKTVDYKLTMVYEPGYKKNISLKRLFSHYIMGKNLKKYLKNRSRPDLIYCAVPSLSVAKIAAKYAKENNIKFVIDIQDIWPDAFKMVFNIPIVSNLLFFPLQKTANFIYSSADEIIAVSETYAEKALRVNRKVKRAHIVYLGTNLEQFDKLKNIEKRIRKPKNEFWIAYVGTLGHSYDLVCVIDALKILRSKGINNIKFIVMGDGPLKEKFEVYAKKNCVETIFTGRLDYSEMVSILTECDVAVNPITHGAAQSIINKHADYSAAGLPVLNTQESEEYKEIVRKYGIGFNCINNNAEDLADKILLLYYNADIRKIMKKNSRKLAEDKFDRNKTYSEIFKILEEKIEKTF